MISTTAQYALRALLRLGAVEEGEFILGRDLAEQEGIPANYLSKILLMLRNAGILSTTRGSGGGYRLRKPPEQIRLVEVIQIFDAPRVQPSCLLGLPECSDVDPCSAHESWKVVRTRFLDFLESTTLADISHRKRSDEDHVSRSLPDL